MSYLLAKELKRSKYRLLGLVGQGQFGRVYCATHRKTGRLVALKELDKQRFPTHKFLRELRFLLSLQHDNIVTCHALEHTSTGRYLVMDYCEGGTLRGLMEDARLHPVQCLKLVVDILTGLDHAHGRGIVHCDIKPENILLTLTADGWRARISDFGIARVHQEIATDGIGNTGSPAYMAPERFYGQYSAVSDLYAVGILLFELLVGDRPFSGSPVAIMTAHLNQPVKIPDTVPTPLQTVILKALQKLPGRRFHSAMDMLTAVHAAAEQSLLASEVPEQVDLLRSPQIPISPCQLVRQEPLAAEVRQIVTSCPAPRSQASSWETGTATDSTVGNPALTIDRSDQIYQVFKQYVGCQTYPEGWCLDPAESVAKRSDQSVQSSVRLPGTIRQLLLRPQGGFAVTQRSVYRIGPELFQPGMLQHGQKRLQHADSDGSPQPHAVPELVAEFSKDFLAAIEARGRWMAVATLTPDSATTLSIWNLWRRQPIKSGEHGSFAINAPNLGSHLFHLMMPDSRHVVAFSHDVDKGTSAHITGVRLDIFTRRGNPVSTLRLPVPLRYVLSSATPYRLIAMEPGHSHSVLLIDLKPLKMLRIGVDIAPTLLAAPSWGYVLVSADGQIVLLNRHGQGVGCIEGPANPTAIAVLEPYGLFIATWQNGQGTLSAIDLRQLDTGMIF